MDIIEATVQARVIDALADAFGDDYEVQIDIVKDLVDFYEELNEGSVPPMIDPDAVVCAYNFAYWQMEHNGLAPCLVRLDMIAFPLTSD